MGRAQFFTPEVARQQLTDWLFIETLDDLAERAQAPRILHSKYRILGIAPLLRKLTLDSGKSLLHLVRRVPGRPPIAFDATPYRYPEGYEPTAYSGLFAVSGSELSHPQGTRLSLDQFLAIRVGHIRGHDLTARDVIRHYSNVEGGVHLGKSEGPINDLLQFDAPPQGILVHLPQSHTVLIDLAEIMVAGCADLLAAVRDEYEARRSNPSPDMLGRPALLALDEESPSQ